MDRGGDVVESIGVEDKWAACELGGRRDVGLAEVRMPHLQRPVSTIPARRLQRELEAGDRRAVDGFADLQDRVVVGRHEV